MQELGRAGRDGKQACATLYVNNNDIGANLEHLSDDMRKYCNITTCRREFITNYFGFEVERPSNIHFCCDICRANKCKCQECSKPEQASNDVVECIQVPAAIKDIAKSVLSDYFTQENAIVKDYPTPSFVTGLCSTLASEISDDSSLWTEDSLKREFPYIENHYLETMAQLLDNVKNMKL